ncbi:hypothetical protein A8F94_18370 [Bacillus sp. FJAT-27225]|uniref:M20/M25/M40 family metallo-hydrolase n=1 Tax=Bacillus sp. FJAT-27225 TaxID=1743144 RepID=UPI00080C2AC8|nr:M20/M25/M40 family metallo-hydrolase [Bacillus sp. FJAT-27225]OCA83099.1 hypothetical protein A8F94_18370 [Bacillus sp. FJAT-27225]
MLWQTKDQMTELLTRLVSIPSITGSDAELLFPEMLALELKSLPYFQQNSHHLHVHKSTDTAFLTAFVEKPGTRKTIVMISHFDVVGTEDYGQLKEDAFSTERMTRHFHEDPSMLTEFACSEFESGEWIFGRGTMDMKAGLVVQMSLLEKASYGEIDGNLLLVTVSDEEVGSKGMLAAVEEVVRLQEECGLDYVLCLNSEPSFREHPLDTTKYFYTGTIGKIMPTFYCAGQETHVGEPFAGLNASLLAAAITMEFELSTDFAEQVGSEATPPLTNLMLRDLKESYNVQTPTSAVAMFNLLYMEQEPEAIARRAVEKARKAARRVLDHYHGKAESAAVQGLPFTIPVYTWAELFLKVEESIGSSQAQDLLRSISEMSLHAGEDERGQSLRIVQEFSMYIEEKPFIVFYFSPPFYPAVSSRSNQLVRELADFVIRKHPELQERAFFPGLCDLSYATSSVSRKDIELLTGNTPLYKNGYSIPFESINKLTMPVFNIGPYGADAHQKTERLELNFSFDTLPGLLKKLVQHVFHQ